MVETLNLAEFIELSLIDIVKGVASASSEIENMGGSINPNERSGGGVKTEVRNIDFDIAVFAEQSSKEDAGGRVSVAGFIEASMDGSEAVKRSQRESRIRFQIPLQFPVGAAINKAGKTPTVITSRGSSRSWMGK